MQENKIEFIIQVSGDSSVGDWPYELNVTLMNDGRDEEEFIEHSKEVLKDLYGQEYKVSIFTAQEFDRMVEQYQSKLEG